MRLYVNIYEASRAYGGPEEGGWWFDTGSPIGSIPVELTDQEREEIHALIEVVHGPADALDPELYAKHFTNYLREKAQAIREKYEERYPNTGKRSSVLGGTDHTVCIEDHFARPYPEEYPRYE